MFAVGHLSWGYLAGKTSSETLGSEAKAYALFTAAILPDIDLLLPLEHRGPTHSMLLATAAFTVAFIIWRSKAIPYFAALTQHNITDALDTLGAQLLWPATATNYKLAQAPMKGSLATAVEWTGFLLTLTVMLKTGDARKLLKPDPANLLTIMPLGALLGNILLWHLPTELIIPTALYLTILSLPIIADLRTTTNPEPTKTKNC